MSFYSFMMLKHINGDGPESDLARDMLRDRHSFPKDIDGSPAERRAIVRAYLIRRGACRDCLKTFENCWKEYLRCLKKR